MVAKIASDEKKPDGQTRIPNDREEWRDLEENASLKQVLLQNLREI